MSAELEAAGSVLRGTWKIFLVELNALYDSKLGVVHLDIGIVVSHVFCLISSFVGPCVGLSVDSLIGPWVGFKKLDRVAARGISIGLA